MTGRPGPLGLELRAANICAQVLGDLLQHPLDEMAVVDAVLAVGRRDQMCGQRSSLGGRHVEQHLMPPAAGILDDQLAGLAIERRCELDPIPVLLGLSDGCRREGAMVVRIDD
jgi:hypothetical protein